MSTNALAVAHPQYEDAKLLETIKQTVCKGATDAQFRMFIEVCKSTGLNPFLKEVYYVPEKGIIMAARDGYLRVANEHPQFDGMETTVERDEKNVPIKAICRVWRKDRGHPTTCEAYYNEYKKSSPVWTQYPSAMISKVAEVLALKRSFSINGCVTEEEIGNTEERGTRAAQDEYLRNRGIERQKPVPREIQAFADIDPEGTEIKDAVNAPLVASPAFEQAHGLAPIEMRSAAKVAEAESVLADVKKDEAKGRGRSGAHGVVPLDKLENWKKLKLDIRAHTGNDDLYKAILRTKAECEHSNEIQTEKQAKDAWDALKAELKRLGLEANRKKQDAELMATLDHASEVIGQRAFGDVLFEHSCNTIGDALALDGDALQALLTRLKTCVDARKGAA
jgi:phage recombination protein Bet